MLAPTAPPALKIAPNPLLQPALRSVADVERDLDRLPHLAGDRRFVRRNRKAEYREAQQAKTAADALGRIPGDDEALHLLVSGKFALWDFCPAILSLAGCAISRLVIATLGFSRRNITKLAELIDARQIGKTTLLYSHYFNGTSGQLCEYLADTFAARADRAEYLSVRTHAKILCVELSDGRRVTLESSANLRSCKNLEQVSAFGDPGLFDFHAEWIGELFQAARTAPDGKKRKASP